MPTLLDQGYTFINSSLTGEVPKKPLNPQVGTAGVVVSCKIPILATRVRFPGSARFVAIAIRLLGHYAATS